MEREKRKKDRKKEIELSSSIGPPRFRPAPDSPVLDRACWSVQGGRKSGMQALGVGTWTFISFATELEFEERFQDGAGVPGREGRSKRGRSGIGGVS